MSLWVTRDGVLTGPDYPGEGAIRVDPKVDNDQSRISYSTISGQKKILDDARSTLSDLDAFRLEHAMRLPKPLDETLSKLQIKLEKFCKILEG